MLINLSNHPSSQWSHLQKEKAEKQFGTIFDLSFPEIDPKAGDDKILALTRDYFMRITAALDTYANEPLENAVHIQGEFTFVFAMVTLLLRSGITCIVSTTRRTVKVNGGGEKLSKFEFVRFRKYISL